MGNIYTSIIDIIRRRPFLDLGSIYLIFSLIILMSIQFLFSFLSRRGIFSETENDSSKKKKREFPLLFDRKF